MHIKCTLSILKLLYRKEDVNLVLLDPLVSLKLVPILMIYHFKAECFRQRGV